MDKEELYKKIKIGGMISFIPIILATGPLAGYFIGDYIEKRFDLPSYAAFICIGAGFAASILEVARIIRKVLSIDRKK